MTTETWVPGAAPPEALEWGPVRLDRWVPADLADQYAAVDASREHLAPFMPWSHGYEPVGSEWYLADSARAWEERTAFNDRVSAAGIVPGRVLGSAGIPAKLRYARLPEQVPGPPGWEHIPMVCWVVGQQDWSPVRG